VQIVSEVSSKLTLAPLNSEISSIFVASDAEGSLYALAKDPRQLSIFTPPKPVEQPKPIEFKTSAKK